VIRTILNADDPIVIGNVTLLETTLDSLGFRILDDKIVYAHFTPGNTYYFHSAGGGSDAYAWLVSCTEQEFWLTANMIRTWRYRHYFLDNETGLKLLEDRK
jgi:hypothetical protein